VTQTSKGEFRLINPTLIKFSNSVAQAERRKHFNAEQLKELIESVKANGIVQPIVVRPAFRSKVLNHLEGDPEFEVVAGERRVIAARKVGLEVVPAMLHQLDDEQALDVQLIENLQREGLHPLVEAEGYEDLKGRGHSIEEIADRVGKSTSYIYKRLELTGCCKQVRAAFYDGKIDASRALALATIKDEEQQKQCLKEITAENEWRPAMSFRQVMSHIRENYRLQLSSAPFKTEDANLVPAAGPCGKCPKNTSRQPEDLFGDVSKNPKAMCTDSKCFQQKCVAAAAIVSAAARANGQIVIEGDAAKKIIPKDSYKNQPSDSSGYVALDEKCYDDPKYRTYREIIGKHMTPAIVISPKDNSAVEVIKETDFAKACKDKGIKLESRASSSSGGGSSHHEAQKKAKAETKFRRTTYEAVRPKLPEKLGRSDLAFVASTLVDQAGDESRKELTRLWMPDYKGEAWNAMRALEKKIDGLKEHELVLLIQDCRYARELRASTYSNSRPEALLEAAKRARVDVDKIRKECTPVKKVKAKKAAGKKKA